MEIVLIIAGITLIGVICAVLVNNDNKAHSEVKNNVQSIFNEIVNSGGITPTKIFKPILGSIYLLLMRIRGRLLMYQRMLIEFLIMMTL